MHESLYEVKYNGCIKINLWLDDKWASILIEDRLATVEGKLIYGSCQNTSSFWLPLLEKAFAKYILTYFSVIFEHSLNSQILKIELWVHMKI